jgi:pyrroline-5-carboxylate reductase
MSGQHPAVQAGLVPAPNPSTQPRAAHGRIGFIGGGNMASAIIGGLIADGVAPADIDVVEPFAGARANLETRFGVAAATSASDRLVRCDLIVWAVKPQQFQAAAQSVLRHVRAPLHLSIAAGVSIGAIGAWLATDRIVRAMPNTPALIGKGVTGLFAGSGVGPDDRKRVEEVLAATGTVSWLAQESLLDAVTAVSGSGPAYVFYFLEAMIATGIEMGLDARQARELALGTFIGASALAADTDEPVDALRQRVTSPGGTTHAAIRSMEADDVAGHLRRAMLACRQRAEALGREFDAA